ncbi:hypothetical protein [Thiorhodospira sibirica]|uniref:hypothetical protein n=1 Tax=Thiorhodospira sibirica TaxID=154347 RepID=UPI00022C5856|nr:hypothetical protein [Thiorhodospira sibirica]
MTPKAAADEAARPPSQGWRHFIIHHDQSLLFALTYIALTISLSLFISYFWLLVIVGVHILLEYLKKTYLHYPAGTQRLVWTLWDVKYDLILVFMALVITGYSGTSVGIAGAQSLGKAGAIGTRLAWSGRFLQKLGALKQPLVKLLFSVRVALFRRADMLRQASRGVIIAATLATRTAQHREAIPHTPPTQLPWHLPLSKGDWFALVLLGVNLSVLLLAPWITDHTGYAALFAAIASQLHPWPFGP